MSVDAIVGIAVSLAVEVIALTVTIFVWITVTTLGVCDGAGVAVAEGVFEGRNVGETVTDGVSKA